MMYGLQMNAPELSVWGPQLYFIQIFFFKTFRTARVNLSLKFDGLPFKFRWDSSSPRCVQFNFTVSSHARRLIVVSCSLQQDYSFIISSVRPNFMNNSFTIWIHNEEAEEYLHIIINQNLRILVSKGWNYFHWNGETKQYTLFSGLLRRPGTFDSQLATISPMQFVRHGVPCPCEWQWPSVRHSIDGKTKQSTYAPLPCLL